jgi:hypothetical protein
MEELVGLSFAMGVPKRKTRQQKKEEAKKALYEHVKRKQRDKNLRIIKLCRHLGIPLPVYEPEYRVIIKPKRWFLLKGYPNHVDVFMYHAGNTIHEILRTISKHIKGRHADQRYKMLRGLARENQRVRSAFGALARLWIRSRVRAGNEDDLITGVAPTHPIVLMDWRARRRYVFEPQTILRDMVTRLQMSYCSVFPKPHFPRNPYTNTDISQGQFYSIVKQLRALGITHWTLEALYSVEYNLTLFEKEMYIKLKNTILHGLFSNHKSISGMEVLLEFIEDEHNGHNIRCNYELYEWALENAPTHPRIVAWRNLCSKHYKISNMIPPHPDADSISIASLYLCTRPVGLEIIRNKASRRSA